MAKYKQMINIKIGASDFSFKASDMNLKAHQPAIVLNKPSADKLNSLKSQNLRPPSTLKNADVLSTHYTKEEKEQIIQE